MDENVRATIIFIKNNNKDILYFGFHARSVNFSLIIP